MTTLNDPIGPELAVTLERDHYRTARPDETLLEILVIDPIVGDILAQIEEVNDANAGMILAAAEQYPDLDLDDLAAAFDDLANEIRTALAVTIVEWRQGRTA